MVGVTGQVITSISQCSGDIVLQKNESNEMNYRSTIVKSEPIEADEMVCETQTTRSEIGEFTQERIEQEPIEIKDEPMESDYEEIDNETIDVCNNEDKKYVGSRKRKRPAPVEVKAIPNKCYICDTILESKNEFNHHLETHSKMLPYKCSQCSTETNPIIYSTLALLNKHFETHSFNFICPYCPLKHRRMKSHVHHIQTAHNEKKKAHKCKTCGKEFISGYAFQNHTIAHKNLTTERYKCKSCQKVFATRYKLRRHQNVHRTESAPLDCEKVKKSRKTNHMIKIDDNDATPDQSSDGNSDLNAVDTIPNKCYVCDITLQNKEDFNVHLEGHRVMLPYKCKQCSTDKNPIKIYSMPALNKHFERHGYSHICPQCPLSYRSKRTLQYHIRNAHKEGNVEYTCATCAKVYTNGNDYRNHVNGHRNVMMQRYNCEHCQLSFSRKGHLHRHQKTAGCMSKRAKESELETVAVEIGNASVETVEQKVPLNSREEDRNILEPHENNQLENATKREPTKRKKKSQINRMDKQQERTIPKGVKTASNKCYICDTILESKNDFEEHLKSHENLLPFKGSQFVSHENPALISTVIDLNEHFEKHVFSFICPHCPLRFRLSSKLARHIQSVHEKKKVGHTCETCGKVLENPISFRTHVRAHRNLLAERFKCEPCQKIFSLKHLYLNHKASYVCLRTTEKMKRQSTLSEGSSNVSEKNETEESNDQNSNMEVNQDDSKVINIKAEPLKLDTEEIDGDEMA